MMMAANLWKHAALVAGEMELVWVAVVVVGAAAVKLSLQRH